MPKVTQPRNGSNKFWTQNLTGSCMPQGIRNPLGILLSMQRGQKTCVTRQEDGDCLGLAARPLVGHKERSLCQLVAADSVKWWENGGGEQIQDIFIACSQGTIVNWILFLLYYEKFKCKQYLFSILISCPLLKDHEGSCVGGFLAYKNILSFETYHNPIKLCEFSIAAITKYHET